MNVAATARSTKKTIQFGRSVKVNFIGFAIHSQLQICSLEKEDC